MQHYLDHNATTPLSSVALAAMRPWLGGTFGNSASRHSYGRAAHAAVELARQQLATALDADKSEIIFTSGGSEANNLALKGLSPNRRQPGKVVVGSMEHPSVIEPARQYGQQNGYAVIEAPATAEGYYVTDFNPEDGAVELLSQMAVTSASPTAATAANSAATASASTGSVAAHGATQYIWAMMAANNETGVCQPIEALTTMARRYGKCLAFHCDAVQALGKMPLSFRQLHQLGVTSMSVSAHKVNGPQGVGALVVDKRLLLHPLIAGGGHERGLRSGTLNVAGIVGFAAAAEAACDAVAAYNQQLLMLRQRLECGLAALGAHIFAASTTRLANTVLFAFPSIFGETLVGKLDEFGFAVASGAACAGLSPEHAASHVLLAMGVPLELAQGAVRVSLGQGNDLNAIDQFLSAVSAVCQQFQKLQPLTGKGNVAPAVSCL